MKLFNVLTLLIAATLTLTSCNPLDVLSPAFPKGKYKELDVCLNWGATQQEVAQFMVGKKDFVPDDEANAKAPNELNYEDMSNQIELSYEFREGKLIDTFIEYIECNDKFETMKRDVEKRYNVTFEEETDYDPDYDDELRYYANCPSHHCIITIAKGKIGIEYMYLDFEYTEDGESSNE